MTVMFFPLPATKADVTVTRVFTASTSDGHIWYNNTDYNAAHDAYEGFISYDYVLPVGQRIISGSFFIYRSYIFFDTSALPANIQITSAVLSLYVDTDFTDIDFNVTICNAPPTYPHMPLQSIDYHYNFYSVTGGNESTSTAPLGGYWNVTFSANGLNWIQKSGVTKLCLMSSRDINRDVPSGYPFEEIRFYSADMGVDYAPKLYVTYTVSLENMYTYYFYGPYLDSGAVYNGRVAITIYQNHNETETFTLIGTGGTAASALYVFEQPPIFMSWNISTANETRVIYFTDAQAETFSIFVPSSDLPHYTYSFTVTDFSAVTDGYLESRLYFNGEYQTVERRPLSTINDLPFVMQWEMSYQMQLKCDEGTLVFGFFYPLTEQHQNLLIPYDAFPQATPGLNATVTAVRRNATWIQVNYTDWSTATMWMHLAISHGTGTYTSTADYSTNITSSANTVVLNWYSADADVMYYVTVTAYRDGAVNTYRFMLPAPAEDSNPWSMLDTLVADINGFPIRPKYIIGLCIVLAFVGIFSYAHATAGAFAGVLSAAFLTYIGWLNIPWVLIAVAGAVAMFIAVAEFKKQEREI